jgi:hypothetical protein
MRAIAAAAMGAPKKVEQTFVITYPRPPEPPVYWRYAFELERS